MWTKIAGIILRNRIAFIAGVLLGTIFMGFQARKIQMSYESADLLPKTDSAYLDYTRFRETFGQEGNVMVFAIQDSGFYQLNKTNDWIQMGNDIKALQGVNALMSITHTFNLQKNTDLKKFEVLPIFPSHIETQAELDSLAYVAEHLPFYDGMLINRDKLIASRFHRTDDKRLQNAILPDRIGQLCKRRLVKMAARLAAVWFNFADSQR